MKHILVLPIILVMSLSNLLNAQNMKTFHDFEAQTITGDTLSMSIFKGKKLLVVNVASKCGHTKQYKALQEIYESYGGDTFEIIGFPANNFMKQEPGTDEEIMAFCQLNYGVTFTMMSKISVRGANQHPIYQWLTKKSENGVMDVKMKWNFQKFMIDENGVLVDFADPKVPPTDEKIINWITQ